MLPWEKSENKQALMHAENLTLPSVQVIVISANLGCAYCLRRASQVIARMSGLREYTVDLSNQQVTVKGDTKFSRNRKLHPTKFRFSTLLRCIPAGCCMF